MKNELAQNIPAPVNDDTIDLGDLFNTLWRGKLRILLWMLLFGAFGAFYAFEVAVPKYRAGTTILLDTTEQSLLDLGVSLPSLGSESEAINTEVQILKSRRLIAQVATASNLKEDQEFNPTLQDQSFIGALKEKILGPKPALTERKINTAIVDNLLDATNISNIPNTYTLKITVETENAEKSASIADQIALQYIQYKKDVKRTLTEDSTQWLSNRVVDLKAELEVSEAKVSEFSTSAKVISPEVIGAFNLQLKDQRERVETAEKALRTTQERVRNLNALRDAEPIQKLDAVGSAKLRTVFRTEGASPEFDRLYNQAIRETEQQVDRENAQVIALKKSVTELENRIVSQNQELIQLQQLSREAEANRLLYEYFLSRLKENSAQEGIQQGQARILSYAEPPNNAAAPKKNLLLAMSMIVGLFFGSGHTLLKETRTSTFRDPSDIERETRLPLLGQIPIIPAPRRRSVIDYLADKPTSGAAEAIRNLRTSILLSDVDKAPQIIMTTSSLPGEGKTTISFALAQNYVGLGKKVLLIEGDIRRLVFSQYLKLDDPKGLMSVLSGQSKLEDVVVKDDSIGADILVSEPISINAADLLSSDGFKSVLDEARKIYDYIIIDTPPVLVVPDARVIAQVVDAVIMVIAWDKTTRSQVRDAIRMFNSVGVELDGLVLNQISIKGMKGYGYGSDYGAYGQYGTKYYTN